MNQPIMFYTISSRLEGDQKQMSNTVIDMMYFISMLIRSPFEGIFFKFIGQAQISFYNESFFLNFFEWEDGILTKKFSIQRILACVYGTFKKNRFKPGSVSDYYNKVIIENIDNLYWKKVEIIKKFIRSCKVRRLAKLSKTRAFCEWFYAPQNIGGLIAKKELAVIINE